MASENTFDFIDAYQKSWVWDLGYGCTNFNTVAQEKIKNLKLAELNKWLGIFTFEKLIGDLDLQDKRYLNDVVTSGVFPDPNQCLRYFVVFYMDKSPSIPDQKDPNDNCISIPNQVHSSILKVINEWSKARGFHLKEIQWTRFNGSFNLEILVLPEPSEPSNNKNENVKPESVSEHFIRLKFE